MDLKLKKLVRGRATIRGKLTRFSNFIESLSESEECDISEIEQRISDIKAAKLDFEKVQEEIEEVQLEIKAQDEEEEEEVEKLRDSEDVERAEFEERYYKALAKASKLIKFNKNKISNNSNQETSVPIVKDDLQKIKVPSFSGKYEEWLSYKNMFVSMVLQRSDLSNIRKFHYLRTSLIGEPLQAIQSLELSDENFEKAWQELIRRYENKKLIAEKHIKALFNEGKLENESSQQLKKLINNFVMHVRALESLGEPIQHWDSLLIYIFKTKLDYVTLRSWEIAASNSEKPSFWQFIEFVEKRIQMLESMINEQKNAMQKVRSKPSSTGKRTVLTSFQNKNTSSTVVCIYCKANHQVYTCPKFLNLTVAERWDIIKSMKCCINCLRLHDLKSECRFGGCKQCKEKHNSLLHVQSTSINSGSSSEATVSNITQRKQQAVQIILATALVDVEGPNGKYTFRALLDSGSQSNFITERAVQTLGLKRSNVNMAVFGIGEASVKANHKVTCSIFSRINNFSCKLECLVLSKLTHILPTSQIEISNWEIPNIKLADPTFYKPNKIDLLIGAQAFWQLLTEGKLNIPLVENIVIQNTHLGWVVSGQTNTNGEINDSLFSSVTTCNFSQLEESLQRFWKLEQGPEKLEMSKLENECEAHFKDNVKRDEHGRFIVRLPCTSKVNELGSSENISKRRFLYLEEKLQRNPKCGDGYRRFMEEYESLGHMSKVEDERDLKLKYYLPHHAVVNDSSTTTKLRVVFDASCKTTSGLSLNDVLLVGPVVQDDLFAILLRFRQYKYAFVADVEKMYRQIEVNKLDRHLQRIWWRRNTADNLQEYELNTVTYGTASAPYLATRCLVQLAIENERNYPDASRIVRKDFYVDDVLSGHNSLEHAKELQTQINLIMRSGCFRLHKWSANHPELVKNIAEEDREPTDNYQIDENKQVKTLGLLWNPSSDSFSFCIKPIIKKSVIMTKREVLANIFNLFDPLGLLAPVVIKAKIFLQELWKTKLDWDAMLPFHMQQSWELFRTSFEELSSCSVPRWIGDAQEVEIHGFCDASELAYGACIYARCTNSNGETRVHLLTSKTRVAPVQRTTLPRLELCGAVLLATLSEKIRNALHHDSTVSYTYWTDSTVVLSWIRSESGHWKTFVANRIAEIQRSSDSSAWRHVPTKDNPADHASRGLNPGELRTCENWWTGPPWLKLHNSEWPVEPDIIERPPEAKGTFTITIREPIIKIEDFSKLNKLQRVMAFCQRFIYLVYKHKNDCDSLRLGELAALELDEAICELIKISQREKYSKEIANLQNQRPIEKKSVLLALNPLLDQKGLLRVGGRLNNGELSYEQQHPIILPKGHHLTRLIAIHEHERQLHAPPQLLLSCLRTKYWPLGGRNLARSTVHKCVRCFKQTAKPIKQLMGMLPKERTQPARTFTFTGLDYAGPLSIRAQGRKNVQLKCYICLFICMSVKAIHLELVSDLSSAAFLQALKRFIARRGRPAILYSDNATTFIGADRVLKTTIQSIQNSGSVMSFLAHESITWKFIPPRAPHFGGLWEAGVKSVKYHLRRQLQDACLTFEELYTALTQIEACLNSRPISPMSSDPRDLNPLTPGHFLVGEPLTMLPERDITDVPMNRLTRFQRVQKLVQSFWKRWVKEYLPTLQQRKKWKVPEDNLRVNDLVLIQDELLPPAQWKLGRITAIHPGTDGLVRTVTLRTADGQFTRPIVKLCPLPNQSINQNEMSN